MKQTTMTTKRIAKEGRLVMLSSRCAAKESHATRFYPQEERAANMATLPSRSSADVVQTPSLPTSRSVSWRQPGGVGRSATVRREGPRDAETRHSDEPDRAKASTMLDDRGLATGDRRNRRRELYPQDGDSIRPSANESGLGQVCQEGGPDETADDVRRCSPGSDRRIVGRLAKQSSPLHGLIGDESRRAPEQDAHEAREITDETNHEITSKC